MLGLILGAHSSPTNSLPSLTFFFNIFFPESCRIRESMQKATCNQRKVMRGLEVHFHNCN